MNKIFGRILKELILESIDASAKSLQERIGDDIFSSELNLLYRSRIYGAEAEDVRETIAKIAEKMDIVLNRNQKQLLEEISQLLEEIPEDSESSIVDKEGV